MSLTWHVIDACQSCDVTQTLADWEARSCCLANAWDNWHGAHPLNRHPVMVGCNNRLAGFSSFSYKFKTHRSNGSINHCETPSFLDSQPFWPLRTSGSWTPTLHVRLGAPEQVQHGQCSFFFPVVALLLLLVVVVVVVLLLLLLLVLVLVLLLLVVLMCCLYVWLFAVSCLLSSDTMGTHDQVDVACLQTGKLTYPAACKEKRSPVNPQIN